MTKSQYSSFLSLLTSILLFHCSIQAQTVPYTVSSVQGSNIITNYYDPNAGPSTGPGLPPSPLEGRFNQPLGKPLDSTVPSSPILGTLPTTTSTQNYQTGSPILGTPSTYPSTYPSTVQPGYPQTGVPAYPQAQAPLHSGRIPIEKNIAGLPSHIEEPNYTFPGLLVKVRNHWVGSDYLYEVPKNIGIVVEVVHPENRTVLVDANKIKNQISRIFIKGGINPESEAIGSYPPLPFFHVLIFAYPTNDCHVAAISGRLFERVAVGRLDFNPPGTWQAITWEKQDLIMTSQSQFNDQLLRVSAEIATEFVDRLQYFDKLQLEQKSEIKLKSDIKTIKLNGNKCPPPPTR